ncbi:hypothetical protein RHMOL_Rhmol05G0020900 [Rhododendron molle]|uniref:Uncharacterized protein n=1 Tax=Rhododendron molle TaxID=49168 RepID=A0ACC0NJH8_RHOML|nr:hypothetical protein RHMOL_Rhmol05G0020900 [Rhododendron molle]
MNNLNKLIEDMEFVDLSMLGRKFTWSNSQDGEKWSKIDRFLLHHEWLDKFKFKIWGLPKTLSDHCPLILMEDDRSWGPKPFKSYNFWFSNSNCINVMKNAWENCKSGRQLVGEMEASCSVGNAPGGEAYATLLNLLWEFIL